MAFLTLAVELRRHGHEPVLALSPFFASLAEQRGIAFVPIGPDVRHLLEHIQLAAHTSRGAFPAEA